MPDLITGLDLGTMQDHSALAVVERTVRRRPEGGSGRQNHYGITHLSRWPLGTPYTAVAAALAGWFADPLRGAALAVDYTGVGVPVLEIIRAAKPRTRHLVPVTITGGNAVKQDGLSWHVAKVHLVSNLQSMMQQGRVAAAPGLAEWPALRDELADYRVKITAAGNETFNAREGAHDDLLLALALAAWYGESFPAFTAGSIGTGTRHAPAGIGRAPTGPEILRKQW